MEGVDIRDNKRWQEFNSIVDSKELDIKEKGMLLILFRYVNYKTGYADPSRALIKKLYGTNKNDVLDKVMDSLINKGILSRVSGKGIRSKYYIKVGTQIEPSTTIEPSSTIGSKVGTQIEPIVGTQIEPQKENEKNIKEYIYMDLTFIDDVIDKVKITQGQYDKLVNKFDSSIVNNQILALDNYIANGNGKRYKDHFRVLNTWCNSKTSKKIDKQMKIEDMF